jgi:hypothetical protein
MATRFGHRQDHMFNGKIPDFGRALNDFPHETYK